MKNAMIKVTVTFAIVIIAISFGLIYSKASKKESISEVVEQEIMYMDSKIITITNYLNNIELHNYEVAVSKIEEQETETSSKEEEKTQEKDESQGESTEGSGKQETTQTVMEQSLVEKQDSKINWDELQGEMEIFYSSWPTIVLNLYEIGVSSDKIVEYSEYQDAAMIGIKEQDKKETITNLAKAYGLLYDFMQNTEADDIKKDVINAKANLLTAYAELEDDDWDNATKQVESAEAIFTMLVNDAGNVKEPQKFNINRGYILIGELKNSLQFKDKELFYIKYKNILEELNIFF